MTKIILVCKKCIENGGVVNFDKSSWTFGRCKWCQEIEICHYVVEEEGDYEAKVK